MIAPSVFCSEQDVYNVVVGAALVLDIRPKSAFVKSHLHKAVHIDVRSDDIRTLLLESAKDDCSSLQLSDLPLPMSWKLKRISVDNCLIYCESGQSEMAADGEFDACVKELCATVRRTKVNSTSARTVRDKRLGKASPKFQLLIYSGQLTDLLKQYPHLFDTTDDVSDLPTADGSTDTGTKISTGIRTADIGTVDIGTPEISAMDASTDEKKDDEHHTDDAEAEVLEMEERSDSRLTDVLDCRPLFSKVFFQFGFPSEISARLFLGDARQATNPYVVHWTQLSHILNVTDLVINAFAVDELRTVECTRKFKEMRCGNGALLHRMFLDNPIEYSRIRISDLMDSDISVHFEEAVGFLQKSLAQKSARVLVHCQMGISRSSTVVIAYLMKCEAMSLCKAYVHVVSRRRKASPNDGFLAALIAWEKQLFAGRSSLTDLQALGFRTDFNLEDVKATLAGTKKKKGKPSFREWLRKTQK